MKNHFDDDAEKSPTETIDDLVNKLKKYKDLPAGWDGETPHPTDPEVLDDAEEFLWNLPLEIPIPIVSCPGAREVAVCWDYENFYVVFRFVGGHRIRHYSETPTFGEFRILGVDDTAEIQRILGKLFPQLT